MKVGLGSSAQIDFFSSPFPPAGALSLAFSVNQHSWCATMLKENIIHRFSNLLRLALLILFWSALPAWSADLALSWDANTGSDLEGYGIYFKNIPDSEYT